MRDIVCECGERFEGGDLAVAHVSQTLHMVNGLYFSDRMRAEEIRHAHGFCTHVEHRFEDGARTVCIASNPVFK